MPNHEFDNFTLSDQESELQLSFQSSGNQSQRQSTPHDTDDDDAQSSPPAPTRELFRIGLESGITLDSNIKRPKKQTDHFHNMGSENKSSSNAATATQSRASAPSKSNDPAPPKRKGRSAKGTSSQDPASQDSTPLILPDGPKAK